MRKRIGEFLVEKGVLTLEQTEEIVHYATRAGLRFGESGIALGYLTQEKLVQVFGRHFFVDFFHLDSRYFPKETQELLPLSLLLETGALLLGFKTEFSFFRRSRKVNIGLLDPSNQAHLKRLEEALRQKLGAEFKGFKLYLILADQYLDVLEKVYKLNESEIARRDPASVDPTLLLFVES